MMAGARRFRFGPLQGETKSSNGGNDTEDGIEYNWPQWTLRSLGRS